VAASIRICATNRVDIERAWQISHASNPALFNGPLILQSRMALDKGVITAEGHIVDYATFLWWRARKDFAGACHLFGYPVLVGADEALVAIRQLEPSGEAGV